MPCFFFRPLSVYPIKMEGQIARSFRKNDEHEWDSNLRPPRFDCLIWASRMVLSKRQNQEPGVVATFPQRQRCGERSMSWYRIALYARTASRYVGVWPNAVLKPA